MSKSHSYFTRVAAALCSALLISSFYLCSNAFADLSMPRTDIHATIMKNGSLKVRETRAFKFDKEVNGVYWEIPLDDKHNYTVDKVGLVKNFNEELREFKEDPRAHKGDSDVYSVTNKDNRLQIKLFKPSHSSQDRYFFISYTVKNAVHAYQDIAELNWKFIGSEWKQPSKQVSLTIDFESEIQGEQFLSGKTIHAYGHGNLNGSIKIHEDKHDILYQLPEVRPQEFAEAHLLFQLALVPKLTPSSEKAYERLLNEERELAQQTNELRLRIPIQSAKSILYEFALSLLLGIIIFVLWFLWGKDYKPQFKDTYFRDVPMDLHPALLAYIWRGRYASQDLSAGILRLADKGAISMTRVQEKHGRLSKIKYDYLIEDKGLDLDKKPFSFIDKLCYQILFPPSSQTSKFLLSEYLKSTIKEDPRMYYDLVKNYEFEIYDQAQRCGYFERIGKFLRIVATILCALQTFMLIRQIINFVNYYLTRPNPLQLLEAGSTSFFLQPQFNTLAGILIVLNLLIIIISMILAIFMTRRPQNYEDVKAKMSALRRWFKDFTLLKEAIPGDITIWRELLVLAVVMNVSKEVIDQLKLHAPQVAEALEMQPFSPLLYYDLSSLDQIHQDINNLKLSSKTLDTNNFNSLFGGGGGFSIGGGGGFGGGGGGSF